MATRIISFGWRHHGGKPPSEARQPYLAIDVRLIFRRNPYHNPELRPLRGDHWRVAADIEKTAKFSEKLAALRAKVAAFNGPVYLGCTGGKHRSVYLADRIGRELGIPVTHLDVDHES
jgi:RNase adapter protein RapZ